MIRLHKQQIFRTALLLTGQQRAAGALQGSVLGPAALSFSEECKAALIVRHD